MAYFNISEDGKTLLHCDMEDVYYYTNGSIRVPEGIETIGRYCFYAMNINWQWGLKKVILPSSIKRIEENAFYGNRALEEINIPDSVMYIGANAFGECEALKHITLPRNIKSIEDSVFADCKSITEVSIPTGVEIIGHLAFAGTGIKEIYIPEGVTEIKDSAFFDCKDLQVAYLPATLSAIGAYAFRECQKLKDIFINPYSNYFTNIGGIVYTKDKSLVTCTVPNLDNKTVSLFPETKEICEAAFWYSNIESINFPQGIQKIGRNAFQGCKKLRFVYIPDSVTELEYGCFAYCGIERYRLPSNLQVIPNGIFSYNPIAFLSISDNTREIGSGALEGLNITSLNIPSSVKTIGESAFQRCKYLKNITINEGVEIIKDGVFSECKSLESIIIPKTVSKIGNNTFALCNRLIKIICKIENPKYDDIIGIRTFLFSKKYTTLYVPKNSLNKYIEQGFSEDFLKIIGF